MQTPDNSSVSKRGGIKDFFISFTNTDRAWAEWIAWQLEAVGYKVILQTWDFRPGNNFVNEMDQALQVAKRVVAILSPTYLKKPFARAEWMAKYVEDPVGKERLIIPVRVRECDLKGLLAGIVYIDLTNLEEEEVARQRLLDGIQEGRARPTQAPAFPANKAALPGIGSGMETSSARPPFPQDIQPITRNIELFVAYARHTRDERLHQKLMNSLKTLQREGVITTWHEGEIVAGKHRQKEIEEHLEQADIILLLVSSDFIASDECYALTQRALQMHRRNEIYAIPILLRATDYGSIFEDLAMLPSSGEAIASSKPQDEAFRDVALGIRAVVNKLTLRRFS